MADFDKFMDDIVRKERGRASRGDVDQAKDLIERELRIKRERERRRSESPAQKSRWNTSGS